MKQLYKIVFAFIFCLLGAHSASAQLDTEHYIPPFYGNETKYRADLEGRFSLYLSTTSDVGISGTISTPSGTELYTFTNLKQSSPIEYILEDIAGSADSHMMVSKDQLGTNLTNKGLIIEGDGAFVVNLRYRTGSQGGSLTSKGSVAKGYEFYTAHMFSMNAGKDRSNVDYDNYNSQFFSVMATENNTSVSVNNPRINWLAKSSDHFSFDTSNGSGQSTVLLQKGETITFGINNDEFDATDRKITGWKKRAVWETETLGKPADSKNLVNGTHIVANRAIVVNSGTWSGSGLEEPVRDVGFDQLTPVSAVGKEYIVMKGEGTESTDVERSIIVATEDNTTLTIYSANHLESQKLTTIDLPKAGDYYITDISDYYGIEKETITDEGYKASSKLSNTLYIESSAPIYVMQTAQGASDTRQTCGMSFIPPLKCTSDHKVQVAFPNHLPKKGNTVSTVTPSIKVIANTVELTYQHGTDTEVTLNDYELISGRDDWFAFTIPSTSNDYTLIKSTAAINVGLYAVSGVVGTAGFFSGFGERPAIEMTPDAGIKGSCSGKVTLTATTGSGYTEFYWYLNGELLLDNSNKAITAEKITADEAGYYKAVAVVTCNGTVVNTYPSEEVYVPPCLSWSSSQYNVTEDVDEGTLSITISLSEAIEEDVTFDVLIVEDSNNLPGTQGYAKNTSTTPGDYKLTETNLTGLVIKKGETEYTFTIPIEQDVINEPDEVFYLQLDNIEKAVGYDINTDITIKDDDDPEPKLIAQYMRSEHNDGIEEDGSEGTVITVDFMLSAESGYNTSFMYNFSDVTTEKDADWSVITDQDNTVSFLPGKRLDSRTFTVLDDDLFEYNEKGYEELDLNLIITRGEDGTIDSHIDPTSDDTFGIRIIDNEDTPYLVSNTGGVLEAVEGDDIQFEYIMYGKSQGDITFDYCIVDGTAEVDLKDYEYTAGTLGGVWHTVTLPANHDNPTFSLTIPTYTDEEEEDAETFFIKFRSGSQGIISVPEEPATATIIDATQNAIPIVSIEKLKIVSEDDVTGTGTVTVSVTPKLDENLTINLEWKGGSASIVDDLTSYPTSATISAGDKNGAISFTIADDNLEESLENLYVKISTTETEVDIHSTANTCEIQIEDNDLKVVARDDFFSIVEDSPATTFITVLDNDDLGDAENVTNLINFELVAGVSEEHGTLTFHKDGTFVYEPKADFSGEAKFTYQFWDSDATSDKNTSDKDDYSKIATVTIEVIAVDDLPLAFNDSFSVVEDGTITVGTTADNNILLNDINADGEISIEWGEPLHGTLSSTGDDGTFTYVPNPEFFSSAELGIEADRFNYTIKIEDKPWQSSTGTVFINVLYENEHKPVGENVVVSTNINTSVIFDMRDFVTDADGNFTIDWGTLNITKPINGELSWDDGKVTYTATENTEVIECTYIVYDIAGINNQDSKPSEKKTITITVTESNAFPDAVCADLTELKLGIGSEEDPATVVVSPQTVGSESTDEDSDNSMLSLSISSSTGGELDESGNLVFDCDDIGEQTIRLKVVDDQNAYAYCETTVTIKDVYAPTTKQTESDNIYVCTGNDVVGVNFAEPIVSDFTDNCGINGDPYLSSGQESGTNFLAPKVEETVPTITTNSYVATDASENKNETKNAYQVNVHVYRLKVSLAVDEGGASSLCLGNSIDLKASVTGIIGSSVSLQLMNESTTVGTAITVNSFENETNDKTCEVTWNLTSAELNQGGDYEYIVKVRADNKYDGETNPSTGDDTKEDRAAVASSSSLTISVTEPPTLSPFTIKSYEISDFDTEE